MNLVEFFLLFFKFLTYHLISDFLDVRHLFLEFLIQCLLELIHLLLLLLTFIFELIDLSKKVVVSWKNMLQLIWVQQSTATYLIHCFFIQHLVSWKHLKEVLLVQVDTTLFFDFIESTQHSFILLSRFRWTITFCTIFISFILKFLLTELF